MTDPLHDVFTVLGAGVERLSRLEAAGDWALEFPARDRLKFVAWVRGTGWLAAFGCEPQIMSAGDVCLIGRASYVIASDLALPLRDGRPLYEASDTARLGGDETVALGGAVTFSQGSGDFLLDMLPDVLFVPQSSPGSGSMATILSLLDAEMKRGAVGGEIVRARLADLLLVEAIRAYASGVPENRTGWLGALSDPRLGRVLRAVHGDIARRWTVARLADEAGMSRAAFAASFTRQIGQAPLSYVRTWRLTLARAALVRGDSDIAGVANRLGYTSQSAFTHAFRCAFGTTPKATRRGL